MVPRTFVHRLRRRQFLLRFIRIHPRLHLPGKIRRRDEILAHTLRTNLSRLCFFAFADGAMVFLRRHKIKIPALRVGYRTFKVRIAISNDAHASLGPRKRARLEFGLLEPFRRIIFLFVISAAAFGFRAALARPFVVLHCHVLDSRSCNLRHLSVAEARRFEHHEFRSDQRLLAERLAI